MCTSACTVHNACAYVHMQMCAHVAHALDMCVHLCLYRMQKYVCISHVCAHVTVIVYTVCIFTCTSIHVSHFVRRIHRHVQCIVHDMHTTCVCTAVGIHKHNNQLIVRNASMTQNSKTRCTPKMPHSFTLQTFHWHWP